MSSALGPIATYWDRASRALRRAGRPARDEPAPPQEAAPPVTAQTEYAIQYAGHLWAALDRAYDELLPGRTVTCIVCAHADKPDGFEIHRDECIFGGGRLERYGCPSCGCLFGPQKYLDLPEAAVDADYRFLYSYYSESDSSETEIRTFQRLDPRQDGLYLDWGCGGVWSNTLATLRRSGWDVWGYEPSAAVSENRVMRTRAEISATFDGIFSNNVIEHFRQPVETFRDFHSMLADGGLMAHSSPCFERNYTFTRFHTIFLTGRSPFVLAERTGFEVVDIVPEGGTITALFRKKPSVTQA